jgi:hypothetical protein
VANLLSLCRADRVDEGRAIVEGKHASRIAEVLVEMVGPIKQARLADSLGPQAQRHRQLMRLVAQVACKCELVESGAEAMRVERIAERLACWVERGAWDSANAADQALVASAASMGRLCGAGLTNELAAQLRLVVVAPLAPGLEFLRLALGAPRELLAVIDAAQAAARGDRSDRDGGAPCKEADGAAESTTPATASQR